MSVRVEVEANSVLPFGPAFPQPILFSQDCDGGLACAHALMMKAHNPAVLQGR